MKRATKIWSVAALAAAFVTTCGAYAAFIFARTTACWTDTCREAQARRAEAEIATAQAKARAAWSDVSSVVEQQADIARALVAEARQSRDGADARTAAQMDRISYVTQDLGSGALLGIGRPFLDQTSDFANERTRRSASFAAATQPLEKAITGVKLTVRGNLPPATAAAEYDFSSAVQELHGSALDALRSVNADRLLSAQRATALDRSLRASNAALMAALSNYDRAVQHAAGMTTRGGGSAGGLPVAINKASLTKLSSEMWPISGYSDPVIPPRRAAALPSPRQLTIERARAGAERDIANMDAQAEILEREAAKILHSRDQDTAAPANTF